MYNYIFLNYDIILTSKKKKKIIIKIQITNFMKIKNRKIPLDSKNNFK